MIEIFGIIKRHFEQIKKEVIDVIFTFEVSGKKTGIVEVPTITTSQDIEVGIDEKKHCFTLSVSLLSGEDQITEKVKEVLKEIEEEQNIKFH